MGFVPQTMVDQSIGGTTAGEGDGRDPIIGGVAARVAAENA